MDSNESPLDDILIGKMTYAWAQSNQVPCKYLETTPSTNALAKTLGLADNEYFLIVTDYQTQGRGRGSHSWSSPKGSALLSTWGFTLNTAPQPTFAPRVGMALYKALSSTWPFLPFSMKAPNDIFLGSKKCAGLLIETVIEGNDISAFIGLGLNVFKHPPDVETSTSILENLPKTAPLLGIDWVRFLDRFIFEVTEAVELCAEPLSSTDCESLKLALNKNPLMSEKIDSISESGDLIYGQKAVSWSSL